MVEIRNVLTGRRGGVSLPPGSGLTALNLSFLIGSDAGLTGLGTVQALAGVAAITVIEVGESAANVGQPVAGSGGGSFRITAAGAISFDPEGGFDGLGAGASEVTAISFTLTDGLQSDDALITVNVFGSAGIAAPQPIGTIPDQQDDIIA